ncbi:MAG: DHH family phosphoesterase [Planctomycetota bacterium]
MNDYTSTLSLAKAAELLSGQGGSILVLSHAKPDGDALGSVAALVTALRSLGKDAAGLLVGPIALSLAEIIERTPGLSVHQEPGLTEPSDQLVIVDTGAWSQVGLLGETVRSNLERTLILDHHLSGDIPAAARFVDSSAAAAAEIIADLIDLLPGGKPADAPARTLINDALFTGIASDTGWFRFSNCTPRTHRLAARLIGEGVDHANLFGKLEQAERPEKLQLLIRAVDSLKLLADGRAAAMILRARDFAETGARPDETERLIDIPQQVGSVQAIALITEAQGEHGPQTRVSFRSKPLPRAINVAELAAQFGGGGHARAAGARIDATVDEVAPKVIQALTDAVRANPVVV